MENRFCLSCREDIVPEIEFRTEAFPVRGESIEVDTQVGVCPTCREALSVEEWDELALRKAFDEYRCRHGLLSPGEIVEIRKQYGLSQRALSLVLGWGEITVHRYEMGSIQDSAHDAQLRIAADPRNMAVLLAANGERLTVRQRSRLEAVLMAGQADAAGEEDCAWFSVPRRPADEFSGFRPFDADKFREMVVFFTAECRMFRTKLNKLLFYSDFLNFKQSAMSISGAPYLAFQRGPVPEHYDWMTEDLEQRGDVQTTEWNSGDKSGEIINALRTAEISVFSESELRVLEFVRARFSHATSRELTDLSHAEAAYVKTALRQKISYHWATELSVSFAD